MKKVFLILFLAFASLQAQTRFLSYTGQTGTAIDIINFPFYCWEVSLINDGNITDTLFFWTEDNPQANRKLVLLGGEYMTLRFTAGVNRVYLKGSVAGIKRRLIAKP